MWLPVEHHPAFPPPSGDEVLWDVVDEHLAEAAYQVESLSELQTHPLLTLQGQAQWGEAKLAQHVDALALAGPVVVQRLLEPALAAGEPHVATAATLALLLGGRQDAALAALEQSDLAQAASCARAFELLHVGVAEARRKLLSSTDDSPVSALLSAVGRGGITQGELLPFLSSEDLAIATHATRCIAGPLEPRTLNALERLIARHDAPSLCEAALPVALAGQLPLAKERLRAGIAGEFRISPDLMGLYAAVSNRVEQRGLLSLLESKERRKDAVFALGFCGDVGVVGALQELLEDDDISIAATAAQSLSVMLGIDLQQDALFIPPEPVVDAAEADQEALPEFDQDDLDADLRPPPEESLGHPSAAAFRTQAEFHLAKMDARRRTLFGHPLHGAMLLHALRHASLRTRHVVGDVLFVLSGARHAVDTRALAHVQQQQLESLGDGRQLQLWLPAGWE